MTAPTVTPAEAIADALWRHWAEGVESPDLRRWVETQEAIDRAAHVGTLAVQALTAAGYVVGYVDR